MINFNDLSLIKKTSLVSLLFIVALIISGAIGYLPYLLQGNTSATQITETNWIIQTKIGFFWLSLPIFGYAISKIGYLLGNLLNLNLPFFLSQAIFMGCAFAIFDGVNIMLFGIGTGELWSKVLEDVAIGSLGGGIAGVLIQKTEKAKKKKMLLLVPDRLRAKI